MLKQIGFYLILLVVYSGCVTSKIHNTLLSDFEQKQNESKSQAIKIIDLKAEAQEQNKKIENLKLELEGLKKDSVQNGSALNAIKLKYDELSSTYDLLASKNSRLITQKAKETKKLLDDLEKAQLDLLSQEDQLNTTLASLEAKKNELENARYNLDQRSKKVAELESIINKKDSLVTGLKNSISKALIGLEGDGLSVVQKKGKVYISVEENLLFASGKYELNSNGVSALNKLGAIIAEQKDLQILIEGHTDSIPFSGKGIIKDNWDLSVMRATSVVKVLLKNPKLNPSQLIAAGRAEYAPLSSNATSQGRQQNRRIEMILSPNLDDLFELLK